MRPTAYGSFIGSIGSAAVLSPLVGTLIAVMSTNLLVITASIDPVKCSLKKESIEK